MSVLEDHGGDDPWMVGTAHSCAVLTANPEQPGPRRKIIEAVEPLDVQLGALKKSTVPDVLYDSLFGQPKPLEAEVGTVNGDISAPPYLQTYAILEAGKIMNLAELLDDSGLEHSCLFKGKAYDELRDVAPWIVRLEEDNSFTRNLFTRSDAPWHLWDASPGIYIRSHESLDDIRKHARRFIKLPDHVGRWLYVRFWDPVVFEILTQVDRSSEIWLTHLFADYSFLWSYITESGGRWSIFETDFDRSAPREKLVIGPRALEELDKIVRKRHEAEDIHFVQTRLSACGGRLKVSESYLKSIRDWLRARGFQQRRVLVSAIQAIAERFPEDERPPPDLLRILSDSRKGPGVRLWHIENWSGVVE